MILNMWNLLETCCGYLNFIVENDDVVVTWCWIHDEYVIIVVGYMLLMWIHELEDHKCEVWISCGVLMIFFEKMGQEWRSLILMNWSELMMLLCWVRVNRIFVFEL